MPLSDGAPLPVYQTPQIEGGTVLLQVPWYPFEQTEWCWAACAQMIAFFIQKNLKDQCSFASLVFPAAGCCDNPSACNKPLELPEATKLLKSIAPSTSFKPSPVDFEVIKGELVAGRPVQVGFTWTNGGSHVAVIAGVSEDNNGPVVYVNDPDPQIACGWVYFKNLQLAYGLGSWQWTWTSIH